METKANYFLVGLFTLTLGAGLIFFAAWLMGSHESYDYRKVVIYFPGNVNGIDVGSAVRYRGVLVGRVDSVKIDARRPQYIRVTTQVDKKAPLTESTQATLQVQGITGLSFVELETLPDNSRPLTPLPGKSYSILYGEEPAISKVLKAIPAMIDRYSEVAQRFLQVLDKKNIDAFSQTLVNVEKFTGNLSGQQQNIDKILEETRLTIEGLRTHSTSSFTELNYFLRDSRQVAQDLHQLTKSLEENPSKIIYQPKYNGYKVKE